MEFVATAESDGVMTITLSNVEGRNTLSRQLLSELVGAIENVERDPDIRVVVLTNLGNVFCAGADLAERSRKVEDTSDTSAITMAALFQRIQNSPKPFVGRIAGHCIAGGVGLAAVMDISVAVDTAMFGFTEVRVGIVPATISVVCLPKMHQGNAQSAFLRGNRFPAHEAARMGLINSSVSSDLLDDTVNEIVNDLLAGEPHALAVAKRLASNLLLHSNDETFAAMAKLSNELFASDAAHEGMTAFLEKRPAPWVRKITTDKDN
jgi:methylglutaconyl-CoA hydratase